jgi:hypothetical protein
MNRLTSPKWYGRSYHASHIKFERSSHCDLADAFPRCRQQETDEPPLAALVSIDHRKCMTCSRARWPFLAKIRIPFQNNSDQLIGTDFLESNRIGSAVGQRALFERASEGHFGKWGTTLYKASMPVK